MSIADSATRGSRLIPVPVTSPTAASHSGTSDWLLWAAPGLIWGASFLFIAEGLRAVGPNGLTFLRLLIGFSVLAFVPKARQPIQRSDWGAVALVSVLWMAFPLSMFPYAEQRVSSALTGMLNGATPLFTAMVASAMARQLPARGVVIGLTIGLIGVVMVAWPSLFDGASSVIGVLLILAAVTSYGFATNVAKPVQQRNGALPVIWRSQAISVALTAPLGVPEVLRAQWDVRSLLSIVLLGAFGTAVAQVALLIVGGRLGPTRASATTFLIPGVALVLGVVLRDEKVAMLSVVGGAVCLLGAWMMRGKATPSS
jgi:drug/metabolite transporter (DMT)-like permease